MIVCTNCGFHNDDDDRFCGGCQEYLDWTGTAATTIAEEDHDAPEPDEADPKGLVERVLDRLGGDDDGAPPESAARPGSDASASGPGADGGPDEFDTAAITAETAVRVERVAAEAARVAEEARRSEEAAAAASEQAREAAAAAQRAREEAAEQANARARRLEELTDAVETAEGGAATDAGETADASAPDASVDGESNAGQAASTTIPAAPALGPDGPSESPPPQPPPPPDTDRLAALRAEQAAAQEQARAAEEARRAEDEAAEDARRQAEAAAAAEQEAARVAAAEAEAAERARRAAAMVARPRSPSSSRTDGEGATPAEGRQDGPGPSKPSRRRRRTSRPPASEATARQATEGAEAGDESHGPGAVRPDVARSRRTVDRREPPTRKLRPGDQVCGTCGEGNAPERNFCRRCGDDLAETEVVRQSWWRRTFTREPAPPPAAGTRPDAAGSGGRGLGRRARGARRGILGTIGSVGRVVAMVMIAAAALGIAAVPAWRDAATDRVSGIFTSARRLVVPDPVPVTPIDVTASSEQTDHPAEFAIDNTLNRWWAEDAPADDEARLLVEFAEPVDIAAFGITPGVAPPEPFVEHPRPRRLHLVFSNGTTMDVDVVDDHEFQSFDVDGADGVTSVDIQVTAEWPSQTDSDDVAITTVEFRTLR